MFFTCEIYESELGWGFKYFNDEIECHNQPFNNNMSYEEIVSKTTKELLDLNKEYYKIESEKTEDQKTIEKLTSDNEYLTQKTEEFEAQISSLNETLIGFVDLFFQANPDLNT